MAEKTVEQRCYEALKARGVTFAAAESCTGGLIAKRITDVPGASGVFMGGVVSYTNIVKHRVLGVPAEMLEEYGAVSAPRRNGRSWRGIPGPVRSAYPARTGAGYRWRWAAGAWRWRRWYRT